VSSPSLIELGRVGGGGVDMGIVIAAVMVVVVVEEAVMMVGDVVAAVEVDVYGGEGGARMELCRCAMLQRTDWALDDTSS
jgi:hypothetical protein